jgi:hypothetical protein
VASQKLFLSRAYAVLAWLLAALAVLHMVTTFRMASHSSFTRVWFFGSGVAMAQTAALNLLHRVDDRPELGWVTRGSNIMLGLAAVGGYVTGASAGEYVVILGALATLLLLSFFNGVTKAH